MTRKCAELRLTHPEVSKAPPLRSGSWQPLGAERAFAFLLPPIIFQVSAHLVSTPALELLPSLRGLETLICFHAGSSFLLAPRTRSTYNCSSSSDNSWPKIRLRASAIHADIAASTPSAAAGRMASTFDFNSGFHHSAFSLATPSSATTAKRRASTRYR